MNTSLKNIQELLSQKLPGYDAHIKMMPEGREYISTISNPKYSAVNILMYFKAENLYFILTQRSKNLEYHSGQISLPGGRKDNKDKNLWETAKRETFEEIGVELNDQNFVGELSPLYIDVSNFLVQPFVSLLYSEPDFKTNISEVEKIYKVSFVDFFKKKNIAYSSKIIKGKKIIYPFFKLENQQVWGATAMILQEFFLVYKKLYNF